MTNLFLQSITFLAAEVDSSLFSQMLNPFEGMEINDIFDIIKLLTVTLTSLASLIAIAYIVYGGYQYITSMGNPEGSKTATQTISWAIIGLIITMLAYLIVQFVTSFLEGSPV